MPPPINIQTKKKDTLFSKVSKADNAKIIDLLKMLLDKKYDSSLLSFEDGRIDINNVQYKFYIKLIKNVGVVIEHDDMFIMIKNKKIYKKIYKYLEVLADKKNNFDEIYDKLLDSTNLRVYTNIKKIVNNV